jgi:predicted nucleic acid-binding protein
MKSGVLVDTGPLVASVNKRDRFHAWAKEHLAQMEPPLFTCEPVLAEASFLLRYLPGGSRAMVEFVARRVLEIPFRIEAHTQSLVTLLQKYANVPMSLADACLVRMSEIHENAVVWTLDKHFRLYRRHGRQIVATLMPPNT